MINGDGDPIIYRDEPWDEQILLRPYPNEVIDLTGFSVVLTLTNIFVPEHALVLSTDDETLEIIEPIGDATHDAMIATRCPQELIEIIPWGDYAQKLVMTNDDVTSVVEDVTRYVRNTEGEI